MPTKGLGGNQTCFAKLNCAGFIINIKKTHLLASFRIMLRDGEPADNQKPVFISLEFLVIPKNEFKSVAD